MNYCSRCVYYIDHVDSLIDAERKEDGNDICGYTLNETRNEVGKKVYKTFGDIEICPTCNSVVGDSRQVIYKKCLAKNKDFKCHDFNAVFPYNIIDFIRKVREGK